MLSEGTNLSISLNLEKQILQNKPILMNFFVLKSKIFCFEDSMAFSHAFHFLLLAMSSYVKKLKIPALLKLDVS